MSIRIETVAQSTKGCDALTTEFSIAAERAFIYPFLVSNPTLSNVNRSSLFFRYSQGEKAQSATPFILARNIILFYLKSVFEMLLHFGSLLMCRISSAQQFTKSRKELFVDTYVVSNSNPILALENYFPLLQQVADRLGWKLTILPRLYGSRNPFLHRKTIASLRMAGFEILTDVELLTPSDYLYLCAHVFIYPWLVVVLAHSLSRTREGLYVRFALLSEVAHSSLSSAIRYRLGRKLGSIVSATDCLVQWNENQPFDKTLNRGIRSVGATLPIIGAQLYIGCPEIPNLRLEKMNRVGIARIIFS